MFDPTNLNAIADALGDAGYTFILTRESWCWRVSLRKGGMTVFEGRPAVESLQAAQEAARYFLPTEQQEATRAALAA